MCFPAEQLHRRLPGSSLPAGLGDQAGLVVGATAPSEDWPGFRALVPGLAFLVPGVGGAQGGEAADVMTHGSATHEPAGAGPGGGLLVNVSRGIAGAALGPPSDWGRSQDVGERLAEAARGWAARLPVLR